MDRPSEWAHRLSITCGGSIANNGMSHIEFAQYTAEVRKPIGRLVVAHDRRIPFAAMLPPSLSHTAFASELFTFETGKVGVAARIC